MVQLKGTIAYARDTQGTWSSPRLSTRNAFRCQKMLCDHLVALPEPDPLRWVVNGTEESIFIGLLRIFHPAIETNDGQTPSSHDQNLMRAIILGD